MTWRLAKSLETLRSQVNGRWPNRSKNSDGTIGDDAHSSRSSDHNPWVKDGNVGVVTGLDITHDPRSGCDSYALAAALVASRDKRIKYIITNGKIISGAQGPQPWKPRKYTGKNPHNHHVHISVHPDKPSYDSFASWSLDGVSTTPDLTAPPVPPTLRKGSKGDDVARLQRLLGIDDDGDFGGKTADAVIAFQTKHKIHADGVVGPQTWSALQ